MMKLIVIKAFHDKNTDEFFPIGTMITVSDDRGSELLSNKLGVVELVEEIKDNIEKSKKPKKA